jgi:mono/diheme cytochrome c family protein
MRKLLETLLVFALLSTPVAAQVSTPHDGLAPRTTEGAELYRYYCASCHALDGHGRPAALAGQTPAADLTRLAASHGGLFPREDVRRLIIEGGTPGSVHRTADMPRWGAIFRAVEADAAAGVWPASAAGRP